MQSDDTGTSGCPHIVSVHCRGCNGFGGPGSRQAALGGNKVFYAINDCNAIIDCMASITIRNLEEATKRKLKVRAATNGRSMEQEAREILKSALRSAPKKQMNLAEAIHRRFARLGGVELEPLPREVMRDPDWLKDWKE